MARLIRRFSYCLFVLGGVLIGTALSHAGQGQLTPSIHLAAAAVVDIAAAAYALHIVNKKETTNA